MRFLGCLFALIAVLVTVPSSALAQEFSITLGDDGSLSARAIQLILLLTILSLVPGLAIMITCFPFMVTVLAILRQGIGLQQSPPNMLIVSLALFLTYFVMEPVFSKAWNAGAQPLIDGAISPEVAFQNAMAPFRAFMSGRINSETMATLASLRPDVETEGLANDPGNAPLSVLIPSFLLSEIERAFQIGFLIFLPFLIIDLVVAAVLMSMGMMMVPPAIVSLPFKLAFFVVADGWSLVSGALVRSYF
ncbi:MAG: flagellar type III secretion system pore protein FliP [Boseongicola sp.]